MADDLSSDLPRKFGPRLTEPQKRAIVAAVALKPINQVAADFGVHRNTVANLCKAVRNVPNSPLSTAWRAKFAQLPELAVDAIEASLKDREDVHRAAGTAQTHLKGVGIYASDAPVTNVFVQQLSSLPPDWQAEYVGSGDASEGDEP